MKLSYYYLFLLLTLACQPNPQPETSAENAPPWDLFNPTPPPDTVLLFAENIISTARGERDLALSPDQRELFYTLTVSNDYSAIIRMTKDSSGWSSPQIASFSGHYRDLEPAFSPDGQQLFFASSRPLADSGSAKDIDIWLVNRTEQGWGEAQRLDTTINSTGNEFYPSVAANGNLYFTAERPDAYGREDLYLSRFVDGKYQTPENLGKTINTPAYEYNAYVSPDEHFIIFGSFGREDGLGGGDLYISQKDAENQWQTAQHLPSPINTPSLDYCPFVSSDQQYLFFSSNRSLLPTHFSDAPSFQDLVELSSQVQSGKDNIYWTRFRLEEWIK